jgi:signal transduction histidine kinase
VKAKSWQALVAKYQRALGAYLVRRHEADLQRAYELGRSALNRGFGVLDMARLHQKALVNLVLAKHRLAVTTREVRAKSDATETFLLEALSPFEVAHRGFRDACERLRGLNETLEQRNRELRASNRKLGTQIHERKRAEEALRESREHYIRLFHEARTMEENLRQLSNKVLTVQEEERKHISRELHDEIGQALTAVNVSLALLRSHAPGDEAFRKKVDHAQRLIEQSMDIVHRFARELRPSMLDHLGPVAALQNYVKQFTERTGIKTELEGTVSVEQLNNQQRTVLYRIAQESLTNVFKHAKATRVKIRLRQLPRAVSMEIIDNGRAFPVATKPNGNGKQPLGLLGMQERVRLVNGQFAIESVPKRGTTVRVQIPLPPSEAAPAAELSPAILSASN